MTATLLGRSTVTPSQPAGLPVDGSDDTLDQRGERSGSGGCFIVTG
jgi:hypothetical protein